MNLTIDQYMRGLEAAAGRVLHIEPEGEARDECIDRIEWLFAMQHDVLCQAKQEGCYESIEKRVLEANRTLLRGLKRLRA